MCATMRGPMPRLSRTPLIEVRRVRIGQGLVALQPIAPGALLCRLEGRVRSAANVWRLWQTDPQRAANCIRFDAENYLDPHGHFGAFANHSCDPNSALFKERGRLVMRSISRIATGDEVTHDYSTLLGADDVWTMTCRCRTPRCRGVVREYRSLPARTLRRYLDLGALPAFVLRTQAVN